MTIYVIQNTKCSISTWDIFGDFGEFGELVNQFNIVDQGGPQKGFLEKVGHLAQPADPPPPRKLGRQKKKKKFNVYFAF